jgi:hypothetical protein
MSDRIEPVLSEREWAAGPDAEAMRDAMARGKAAGEALAASCKRWCSEADRTAVAFRKLLVMTPAQLSAAMSDHIKHHLP